MNRRLFARKPLFVLAVSTCLLLLPTLSSVAAAEGIDVSIRLYDARIYTSQDESILIEISIRNDSPEPYRFRLADERIFNLNFIVQTMSNQNVIESDGLITARSSSGARFYREIVIQSEEEYSFVENLTDYVTLPRAGMYVVAAEFYPGLIRGTGHGEMAGGMATTTPIRSNRLTLSVRPPGIGPADMAQARVDEATGEILRREPISPDRVVRETIEARQHEDWQRFFLYMNLESIYRSGQGRERRYINMSEAEQQEALRQFRQELQGRTIDEDIVAMPSEYEIVQTTYTPDNGTVVARLEFRNPGFTEVKQYSYRLRRVDDVWEIYDYSVQNLGTVPNQ